MRWKKRRSASLAGEVGQQRGCVPHICVQLRVQELNGLNEQNGRTLLACNAHHPLPIHHARAQDGYGIWQSIGSAV
jgi:hypothetical protein